MNRPRNGRDYAGLAVIILSGCLGLVLVLAAVAELILDRTVSEAGSRLLTTIGAGLVGALATYIGTASRRRRDGDRGGDEP